MSRKIIAGNWKMNMLPDEAMNFINGLSSIANASENEIILCVPYTDLFYSLLTAQDTKIKIGAQNMHWEENGAYTGEISGKMLKVINVEYVIIGHSERRQLFNETDETVNKKIKAALNYGIKPIVCIGETFEQRQNRIEEIVLKEQINKAFEDIKEDKIKDVIIAYEPIWAIGTGVTLKAREANEIIKYIRKEVKRLYGEQIAKEIIILYGGSVNKDNSKELFQTTDINGGLIGGASLNLDEFTQIINNA